VFRSILSEEILSEIGNALARKDAERRALVRIKILEVGQSSVWVESRLANVPRGLRGKKPDTAYV
jgi:hypothetical protein